MSVSPVLLRLLPGAVLVFAAVTTLAVPVLHRVALGLVPGLPYVVFAGGALLALRFKRGRLVLMFALLAVAERLLSAFGGATSGGLGHVVVTAVGVLLPLDIAAVGWLPERGIARMLGWAVAVVLVETLLVALLATPELHGIATRLARPLVAGRSGLLGLPAPVAGTFLVALLTAAVRVAHFANPVETGTFWTLAAALLGVAARGPDTSLALATSGLVLVVSIVETSHAIAYTDELTGLPTRRALNEALARLSGDYAIAMVDIDHFKKFNDTYGHDIGDQLLRMVGARLASVTGGGRPFRYGGEEFAVLFPGWSVEDVLPHLEALRASVEASGFALRGHDRPREKSGAVRTSASVRRVSVTVSIGVAEAGNRRARPQVVLDAADQALYRAKRRGRNRVCT
jgi:diguanylate cyclase (GGDEF)-like protein